MGRNRKFRRSRRAAERVLETLDRLAGRKRSRLARDERAPGRARERGPRGVRYLTIKGNQELFQRLCREDFRFLMAQRIAAPSDVLEILLPQSVVGRAQNGHGYFVDEYGAPLAFPEAGFDRVLSQLEGVWPHLRHDAVRRRRTELVERVRTHVLAHLDRPEMPLDTPDGPLLGTDLLAGRVVDTEAFLRGMVLAGFMDDIDTRLRARRRRPRDFDGEWYELGGGEIRIVNRGLFEATGIGDPGRDAWDDHALKELEDLQVLMPADERTWDYPQYDQVYFRRRLGDGVCDDLALIAAGRRHGFDAMLGAFVMDGLDTYDKFLARFATKGGDTRLAEDVQAAWAERHGAPLVAEDDLLDLIWFAAKNNAPRVNLSSSHRRFLQTENGAKEATLLHHWRFVQGEDLSSIKLGFSRLPAEDFYRAAHARCVAAEIPVPEPTIRPRRGDSQSS